MAAELDPSPFTLGVASGDPWHTSVVLWTRLAPEPLSGGGMPDVPVEVRWQMARDEAFTDVVGHGEVTARPESAHVVQVIANDLAPDHWYFYRFEADGVTSRIGRTRTLPAPGVMPRRLRFAFASYPAYRDMAERDLDFVLHLGEYRRLHPSCTTSPDVRAAHARFPFITSRDHRTSPACPASHEHLPIRTATDYRRFDWGRLARFSVLDVRQRRDAQERWLIEGLRRSLAHWNVIALRTISPAASRWILDAIAKHRPPNPIVLSGDGHSHSSHDVPAGFAVDPRVELHSGDHHGYVHCGITPQRLEQTLRIVDPRDAGSSSARTLAAFEVRDGVSGTHPLRSGHSM